MLNRIQVEQPQLLTDFKFRQGRLIVFLTRRGLHPGIAIKAQNTPTYPQLNLTSMNRHQSRQIIRIGHLTRHKLPPDQLIQSLGVALHIVQLGGFDRNIGRTDGFVRLLSTVFAAIASCFGWQIS